MFELLLVIAIVTIVSGVALPTYERYLENAKIQQTRADIRIIEAELERYYANNNAYPDMLAQAAVGGMRDPWDNPYQYLRITGHQPRSGAQGPQPRPDKFRLRFVQQREGRR